MLPISRYIPTLTSIRYLTNYKIQGYSFKFSSYVNEAGYEPKR